MCILQILIVFPSLEHEHSDAGVLCKSSCNYTTGGASAICMSVPYFHRSSSYDDLPTNNEVKTPTIVQKRAHVVPIASGEGSLILRHLD